MKIIVINGPMGVGKTTVGRCIAGKSAGTAFIDGDWCMDIHPFVGNRETKAMAVDNILHMVRGYRDCTACRQIVLVWLMDDAWVRERILGGAAALGLEVKSVTLLCDAASLTERWKNDKLCPWRTDEWLNVSLRSLPQFAALDGVLDTSGMLPDEVAARILGI